ncbi:MAG: helix-hairpin-helix domain-containing protein [Crocinitomicaceae bacterium]|nr:helix-hairpin-helix domain-containing protein [Crocinitomicaceae bacterium]MDG1776504.1 helix-hairpin-helix domain-containing protein [Crocinitomicaceae bacterium]
MSLSRKNKQGLVSLLVVGLIIAYIPRLVNSFTEIERPIITSKEAVTLHNKFVQKEKELFQEKSKVKKKSRYKVPPTKFDPNTYRVEDWLHLGLSRRQADVVIKFASHGLSSNKELKKIFVIPEALYDLMKDSTIYPVKELENRFPEKDSVSYEPVAIDINTSGQLELETLPGIGPFYARKIIEYRLELGGYANTSQLMELWKFDVHKFHKVKDYVNVGNGISVPLNINEATLDELKAHPYIDYSVANSIVKLREQREGFYSIDDILESKLIDYPLFDKIKDYIKVE